MRIKCCNCQNEFLEDEISYPADDKEKKFAFCQECLWLLLHGYIKLKED